MAATMSVSDSVALDRYKLLLDGWRRERTLALQSFVGFAIATAVFALISLGGAWWAPAAGLALAVSWLATAAQSIAQQDRLYAQLEDSADDPMEPMFQAHRFVHVRMSVPRIARAGEWVGFVSRYAPLAIPAIFLPAWLAFLILSFFG